MVCCVVVCGGVVPQGVLTEGFFWIPSLAGPASLAARDDGSGTSWLFSWVVSHPDPLSFKPLTLKLPTPTPKPQSRTLSSS